MINKNTLLKRKDVLEKQLFIIKIEQKEARKKYLEERTTESKYYEKYLKLEKLYNEKLSVFQKLNEKLNDEIEIEIEM